MAAALESLLRNQISQRGAIPFREFMEAALYDPAHGYYASGKAAIGRNGDFITNVSAGPLFARLISRQLSEMWRLLDSPKIFTIVEQGAADGTFAADLLEAFRDLDPACFAAASYVIVEPSEVSRRRQRETLCARFESKVAWFPSLEPLPQFEGVHFSNELLDAFPVHRIRWTGSAWMERSVGWKDGFHFTDSIPSPELAAAVLDLPRDLPADYETEVNLTAVQWIQNLSEKLTRGWILLIDYGYPRDEYYRAERKQGFLSAYARHKRIDNPLQTPGEIDLTAHVDFSLLAQAAQTCSLALAGFADQHHFMTGLSRLYFIDTVEPDDTWRREIRAFKTLMHPNFLGASFHALCFSRLNIENSSPLSGFTFGDRRILLRC